MARMVHTDSPYIGRFAPSPTGPLHLGSLVAALGSYLQARVNDGQWHLRMEDLDTQRCMPAAADDILHALERFGFKWDGAVVYQSQRLPAYRAALDHLQATGQVYGCACTRREIADSSLHGIEGAVYPGTCRHGVPSGRAVRAQRVHTDNTLICFDDVLQGRVCQQLQADLGDFVVLRADGIFAYQLAVVVDDAQLGVTEVVRGADLLASTPRQIYLQNLLRLPHPTYLHLPVALNATGQKLSKQSNAPTLNPHNPLADLCRAMAFLSHPVPDDVDTLDGFWRWARSAWRPQQLLRMGNMARL
ncbi:glutamyl-Q tRNA(Asp) synthetase [Sulfuriferula plumbiphila]|uniref:Glutamyl-Q tRNA(Asp) synthetase n=1 Tax=Sulfuriferula plumbiphila TaxID=171865 RepID=A0A512L590_9PROT|nr:tRNA glutamyl-Q(34) synthetase GluQRS [Sulfuriferula plumbiphila]BBP05870.1 glutamyl-Q tRNA(Asp) synthetase [Sulfuriferula plumbiphila]GEP29640.1 glutamyl-Q tRNA(Asp) synthetase [Sulfuriferula plumbiphila]